MSILTDIFMHENFVIMFTMLSNIWYSTAIYPGLAPHLIATVLGKPLGKLVFKGYDLVTVHIILH